MCLFLHIKEKVFKTALLYYFSLAGEGPIYEVSMFVVLCLPIDGSGLCAFKEMQLCSQKFIII
jgi:hypothetical protein